MTYPIHPAQSDEPVPRRTQPFLYNLVYCSRASAGVGEKEVTRIIETARRHNPRFGITGLLVFGGGIFFQWLEGRRDNVTALMALITRDARHDTVVILSDSEEERERMFPEWDMELVSEADIRDVLRDAEDSASDAHSRKALRLLLDKLDETLPDGAD